MPTASGTTEPPQRRQRLGAEERRGQIVRAAIETIAAVGYTNATLTEIARAAGVAKGLIWHYFDDRDDVMRRTVELLAGRLREAVVADLDVTASAPDVIRAVFARTALFTRTHGVELETIDQIVHNLRTPDGQQQLNMLEYQDTYGEHERLLVRGQSEGTIRAADARVMAVAYQGLIDAMIGYLQAHPDVEPLGYAAQMADQFLLGTAAHP